jgi:anthranilate phosphoribosyltransferase
LEGRATPAQRAVVTANAGLAIHLVHPERSLTDCVAEAADSIDSGRARGVLRRLLG